MSGFCGWIGGVAVGDPAVMLRRMAAQLPQPGPCEAHDALGPGLALAARGHAAMAAFLAGPDLCAVIEGCPRWTDPGITAIAGRDGHAAALAAAYRAAGTGLFDGLHGAFSLALIDIPARKALLAIDRVGIGTLCFAWIGSNTLVFGSTTDAVRAHADVTSTVSVQSIFDFLYFVDRVPAPETIYREQRKLAPGEYVLAEPGRCRTARYWQMSYGDDAGVEEGPAADELRLRLRAAVSTMVAREPADRVGAFLSGGLDSSSVAGFAAEGRKEPLKTFTIGFPVRGFDETEYAKAAAAHFRTSHHVYYMQPADVLEVLHKAAAIYDEPFGNLSMIPAFACARLARENGVDLLLAGDGGDEIFAGNERYAKDLVFDRYERIPPALRAVLGGLVAAAPAAGIVGKARRFLDLAAKSVPERMIGNIFAAIDPRRIFSDAAWGEIDIAAPQRLARAIYEAPSRADKIQRMMHFDLRITLADSDLRKVNRMCELAGVRVRYPFLDDDVVAFSGTLPGRLLMKSGGLRQFYKDTMAGLLPAEVIGKQKHGFGLPYMDFLASYEPLRALMCDGLASLGRRGYFRAAYLEGVISRIRDNIPLGPDAVAWDLLMLELWFQSRGERVIRKMAGRMRNE